MNKNYFFPYGKVAHHLFPSNFCLVRVEHLCEVVSFFFFKLHTRVSQPVVREGLPGGTRVTSIFYKNLDSQLSSLRIGVCF